MLALFHVRLQLSCCLILQIVAKTFSLRVLANYIYCLFCFLYKKLVWKLTKVKEAYVSKKLNNNMESILFIVGYGMAVRSIRIF